MAKRKSAAYMTAGEQIAGTVFFVIYLLVLPFATTPLFDLAERLLGTAISPGLRNALYYYILFAVTLIIFHGFLARTTRHFLDNPGGAVKLAAVGLVALYGLNELVYRLTNLVVTNRTNLNDVAISAQIQDAPHMTMLIVLLLAPFVEEVLFRGLVFGSLRRYSRVAAWLASVLLFLLYSVWTFAVAYGDVRYLLLAVQYLPMALALTWCYDRGGSIWSAAALHIVLNAAALWSAVS